MPVNAYGWSTTAGSNTSVGGVTVAEGMAPGGVNNGMRAIMAGVKEVLDAISGAKVTTGSGNAYVLTTGLSISALAAGHIVVFEANHTCTAAGSTIAVDGLTAVDIKRVDGSALLAGDITSSGIYLIAYEATSGDVQLLNPTPNAALSSYPDPTSNDADALGVSGTAWSDLFLASGGVINWNAGDVTITHSANALSFAGASSGYTIDAGLLISANDGGALGASGTAFSDLFLASGGVINWLAGDVTITHSSNTLAFGGASSGYTFTHAVLPSADDGAALGASGTAWADLFLASGGVINFNAGDVTLTHSANTLTLGGGDFYMADNVLSRPEIIDYAESVNAIGSIGGGAQTIDLTLGNVVSGTVDTSTTTFTFSNPSATGKACSFTLILTNGGSQTVNWPASVTWPGGTAPTLTTSGVDVLTFVTVNSGTAWRGMVAGLAFS